MDSCRHCKSIVIGKNGYRCVRCQEIVCEHNGIGHTPFCQHCAPRPIGPVMMRHENGKRFLVINWHGQYAEIKTEDGPKLVLKEVLTYEKR
jgi:hypothetical protein